MTTIKLKNGSGAPAGGDLVQGEPALDLTNKRLYTENASGTVIEVGTNPTSVTTGDITATGTATFAGLTTTADVSFGDNDKAIFGAGSDLQIYHDGSNSYISDQGTGNLVLQGSNLTIEAADGTNYIAADDGNSVFIYHPDATNQVKLSTTSTGIDVTGSVTADGLTVDGSGGRQYINSGHLRLSDGYNLEWGGGTNFIRGNNSTGAMSLTATGDLTLDVTGDIILDADGGDIVLKDGGSQFGLLTNDNFTLKIQNHAQDTDIKFVGNDGGSLVDALTLDMSNAGAATFNSTIAATGATFAATSGRGLVISNASESYTNSIAVLDAQHSQGILSFKTAGTERFRIASDGSLSTPTAGTSNVRFGVNAGNSITSGGIYNVLVGDEAGTAITTGDNNVAIGYRALDAEDTGSSNIAIGSWALSALNNDAASYNVAVGYLAGESVTTGTNNTLIGGLAGDAITTGTVNVAVGTSALGALTTASYNTGIGYAALAANITGAQNTAVGYSALTAATGADNTAVGSQALSSVAAGTYNTAVGRSAGAAVTTGTKNTFVGGLAGDATTTGFENIAIGYDSLGTNTLGSHSVAVGPSALRTQNYGSATNAYNTAVGSFAGYAVTTGAQNTLIGGLAGDALTDADYNTALGYNALTSDTLGSRSVAIGYQALVAQNFTSATDVYNTAVGMFAGGSVTTGVRNTIIGGLAGDAITTGNGNVIVGESSGGALTTGTDNTMVGPKSGQLMTTGSDNTIIGNFSGNQGGLDIRTSSGNIVLSDGDGNPRIIVDNSGQSLFGCTSLPTGSAAGFAFTADQFYTSTTGTSANTQVRFYNGNGLVGNITTDGSATSFNTSSDHRLKENVVALSGATARLKQLAPKRFNFIADADTTVDGFLAHEVQSVVPEAITGTHNEVDDDGNAVYQGIDQSKLVPLLVKAVQEQQDLIDALTARIETLEG